MFPPHRWQVMVAISTSGVPRRGIGGQPAHLGQRFHVETLELGLDDGGMVQVALFFRVRGPLGWQSRRWPAAVRLVPTLKAG